VSTKELAVCFRFPLSGVRCARSARSRGSRATRTAKKARRVSRICVRVESSLVWRGGRRNTPYHPPFRPLLRERHPRFVLGNQRLWPCARIQHHRALSLSPERCYIYMWAFIIVGGMKQTSLSEDQPRQWLPSLQRDTRPHQGSAYSRPYSVAR